MPGYLLHHPRVGNGRLPVGGQPTVTQAAPWLVATVQSMRGVVAVRMTALHLSTEDPGVVVEVLTAHDAVQRSPEAGRLRRRRRDDAGPDPFGAGDVRPAQLLLLADGGIDVREMTR